jgi:hypothetical protein
VRADKTQEGNVRVSIEGRRGVAIVVAAAVLVASLLIGLSPNVDVECNAVHVLTEADYVCFHNGDRGWSVWRP